MQVTRTKYATTRKGHARTVRLALMSELQREEITARIKQARNEAGLTQPEIADLLDVAPRTYQNYEADRVPWGLINDIAKITGKTAQWLLHGETPDVLGGFAAPSVQLDRIEAKIDVLLKRSAGEDDEGGEWDPARLDPPGPLPDSGESPKTPATPRRRTSARGRRRKSA